MSSIFSGVIHSSVSSYNHVIDKLPEEVYNKWNDRERWHGLQPIPLSPLPPLHRFSRLVGTETEAERE